MGSIRRRLATAFLFLVPTSAAAEVCDKVRPFWSGGEATALGEAVALFATPPALILILVTLVSLRFRSTWGGLTAIIGWSTLLTFLVTRTPTQIENLAIEEGCIGPNTLFIVAVVAICVGTVLYTAPARSADKNGDT